MKKSFMLYLIAMLAMLTMAACGSKTATAESVKPEAAAIADTATTEMANSADKAAEAESAAEQKDKAEPEIEGTATEAKAEAEAAAEATTTNDPVAVDWHNYLNGNVFDLTAYAEALGYTWIPDPEWEGLAMYAIEHNGIRYFLCFHSDILSICFGDQEGGCWYSSGINGVGVVEYIVKSRGQEDAETSLGNIECLGNCFAYMRNTDLKGPEDVMGIPSPVSFSLQKYEGVASYYPNGMIKQREFGKAIDGATLGKI